MGFDIGRRNLLMTAGVTLAGATVGARAQADTIRIGALSSVLTGQQCSPNLVHGPLDTWAMAHSTATSIAGKGDKAFVIADYGYGHALQDDAANFLKAAGGTVIGSSAYPIPGTTDLPLVPPAGAIERGDLPRPGQLGERRGQRAQAGGGVRHHAQDAGCGPPVKLSPGRNSSK